MRTHPASMKAGTFNTVPQTAFDLYGYNLCTYSIFLEIS